jgi:hypothetical protein
MKWSLLVQEVVHHDLRPRVSSRLVPVRQDDARLRLAGTFSVNASNLCTLSAKAKSGRVFLHVRLRRPRPTASTAAAAALPRLRRHSLSQRCAPLQLRTILLHLSRNVLRGKQLAG